MTISTLSQLSDSELLSHIKTQAQRLRTNEVALLRLLIEIDDRKLYLPEGYSSLFAFMTEALKFSENCTCRRIAAARAAKDHPQLLVELEAGRLNLSTIAVIAPRLKDSDAQKVIEQAQGLSRKKVEELFALPKIVGREQETLRPVVVKMEMAATEVAPLFSTITGDGNHEKPLLVETAEDHRIEIKFYGSKELVDKLNRALEVLSHKYPDGRFEHVINEGLDLVLAKKDPLLSKAKARRSTTLSQPKKTASGRRPFSKAAKKEAHTKAGGRCTFVSANGTRCKERRFLEMDHIVAFALGGVNDQANAQVYCRAHNLMKARVELGTKFIDRKIEDARYRNREPVQRAT